MSGTRLIPYPELRALEDAAHGNGLVPTRIFALLLPIWWVEVRATVTEAADYAIIDRYLEKAIAEAGLHTVAELAEFFALDPVVVDRALRFLIAIEHVAVDRTRFTLTGLGQQSVRDQKSYRVTIRRPPQALLRRIRLAAADPSVLRLGRSHLSRASRSIYHGRSDGPAFMALANLSGGFRREALAEVAARPDRMLSTYLCGSTARRALARRRVPADLSRARAPAGGRPRYLAYSQVGDRGRPVPLGAVRADAGDRGCLRE